MLLSWIQGAHEWHIVTRGPSETQGGTRAHARISLGLSSNHGFPGGTGGKEPAVNAGDRRDVGLIPGSGRSPGGGHGNPLQYCLENPMGRGAWRATVHRVTKSWTQLKRLSVQANLQIWNLPANAGDARDVGLIPGLGRSPGGGNGNLLQYSCLENAMDRGAWRALVHWVKKSWSQLSAYTHTHTHTHIHN